MSNKLFFGFYQLQTFTESIKKINEAFLADNQQLSLNGKSQSHQKLKSNARTIKMTTFPEFY